MNLKIFTTTLLIMLIGYFIGSISNSIIVSKIKYKQDIRTIGSKNAGSTNIARNYGKKIGFFVLVLDFLKPIIAMLIAYLIKINSLKPSEIIVPAAGLGTIIGHIWPIFFKFKGGKGVACTAGFILMINWILLVIFLITLVIIVKKTRKVSLASIFCPIIVIIFQIIFHFIPHLNSHWFNLLTISPWWINTIFLTIALILIIFKHIPNIKKIILKQESEIDSFKK